MAELRGLRAASFKSAGSAVHWTQAAKEFALECLRLKESVCVGKEVRYLNPAVLFPSVDATRDVIPNHALRCSQSMHRQKDFCT